MGLLDDAIREHLDLKRRRGADPAEVERLEREALGPVRRNTGGATAVDESEPELTDDSAYDENDERGEFIAADEFEAESPYELGGDLEPAPPPADWGLDDDRTRVILPGDPEPAPSDSSASQADAPEQIPPPLDFTEDDDDPFADERPSTEQRPPAGLSDETTEYDVREAFVGEEEDQADKDGDDEDEDVLEETPEFLQDTPDHDRLWFEQRPPRDFDFDD